jgi:pimeloyl-ACP methyl ester carboxylesterase
LLLLAACESPAAPAAVPAAPAAVPSPPAAAPLTPEVVHIDTSDGVKLEADWYPGGTTGVVLLHMIPPRYDRTAWPKDFIAGLHEDGDAVLALDRRGAGKSGGVAKEAYEGPKGRLDVDAAVGFLRAHGVQDVVLIGASNGTTSALDWAVDASPPPKALVWMSPGPYTVQNTTLAALSVPRVLVLYPASEREWPDGVRKAAPATWEWRELPGEAHGTFLFAAHPEVGTQIRAWLRGG